VDNHTSSLAGLWLGRGGGGVFDLFLFLLSNPILSYVNCFDRQEAKMCPLEAHDGGVILFGRRNELVKSQLCSKKGFITQNCH
jgi:hypothetical protein